MTTTQAIARQNAAQAMRKAWAAAKAAEAETGKKASLFFREALSQAWAEIKAPAKVAVYLDAGSVNQKLAEAGINAYANVWQDSRIYINIRADNGFRGNRTAKVYIDIATQKLNINRGKGLASSDFNAALEKIESLFA